MREFQSEIRQRDDQIAKLSDDLAEIEDVTNALREAQEDLLRAMILYGIASAVSDDNLAVAALSRYWEMQPGLCRSMGEFTQCHNPAHGNEAEPNGCQTTELSRTKLNEPLLIVPVTVAEPSP